MKDEGTGIKGDKGESMVRGGGWDVSAKEMSGSRGKVRLKVLKDSKIEDILHPKYAGKCIMMIEMIF